MWIPDKLYRKMPLLYALGGVATLVMFGTNSPSALSSVLLFAAAGITCVWRLKPQFLARQRRPGALRRPQRS
jgi:hypothetical protein